MKGFIEFINEGSKLEQRELLDPVVWTVVGSKLPILSDDIYTQICMDMTRVEDICMVDGVYLTGDLLTRNWDDGTDMDVYIVIDRDNLSQIGYERLMGFLKSRQHVFAGHSRHRLVYRIELVDGDRTAEDFRDGLPGVYDIRKRAWVKVPPSASDVDVDRRVSMFLGRIAGLGLESGARIDWDYFMDLGGREKEAVDRLKAELYDIDKRLSEEPDDVKRALRKFLYGEYPDVEGISKLYDGGKIPPTVVAPLAARFYITQYIGRLEDRMGRNRQTTGNAVPPGGETENRTDPFPDENAPVGESAAKVPGFSDFLAEKAVVKPYNPMHSSGRRRSGVAVGSASRRKDGMMSKKSDPSKRIPVNNGVSHGDLIADDMKKADFGCVPLTGQQELDIEVKYGLTKPDEKYPMRRLGKTDGMALVRKPASIPGQKDRAYLVKNPLFNGHGGGVKK